MYRYIDHRFIFLLFASGSLVLGACNNKKQDHSPHRKEARKEDEKEPVKGIKLESLIRPTNQFVVSTIPVTAIQNREERMEIEALGIVTYDTREVGTISARISGRIEKLYVRYRYQKISKGQRILDIYSPEIQTAQQNLLFLLKNDPDNISLISTTKEKLLMLGMSEQQLGEVVNNKKTSFTITVYSNYSGHVHEAGFGAGMRTTTSGTMKDISLITEELPLKEGMYLQKGQTILNVFNPARAWALLNIYTGQQESVKTGNIVRIVPETAPDKNFRAAIDFIEPFYRKDSKTLTARVYFNNASLQVPIGSQLRATIFGNTKEAWWLPKESVLSLGLDKIVFLKEEEGFRAHKIMTGITREKHIQILDGLTRQDSIALNAQYLMDSESFIKINQ